MSRPDDEQRLRQTLEHAREASILVQQRQRADLDADRVLSLALVRLLEIVGEAANRVSPDTQQRCPKIPWPQIVSLQNRLIHGYDSVDLDILWQILREDLPPLIAELETILSTEFPS